MSIIARKYYWLKLKNDWFSSKVIKKLRKVAGGDTYTIIYLKMQLLSLKNEGKLYYEGIENSFAEELALDLDEDTDDVKITVSFLQSNGLLEALEADEYLLTAVPTAIGSETASAERKRRQRERENQIEASSEQRLICDNVTNSSQVVTNSHTEIDIEKELELESNTSICAERECSTPEPEPIITLPLNTSEEYPFFEKDILEFSELYPAVDILQAMRGMKGWLMTNPTRRKTKRGIKRFVNSWLAKEQDRGGTLNRVPNTNFANSSSANRMTTEAYAASIAGWND